MAARAGSLHGWQRGGTGWRALGVGRLDAGRRRRKRRRERGEKCILMRVLRLILHVDLESKLRCVGGNKMVYER